MKLVSWNVRGLNSPGKLRMLKNMIKMEKPEMCFLQETKCNSSTLDSIFSKAWPGCRTTAVDVSGASGGLAIAWNTQAIALSNLHASHHIIQEVFHMLGTNIHGNLTNVYFPQDSGSKIALIDTIEALNTNRRHPLWIIGGDFNMITKLEEKIRGRNRMDPYNFHFKDFIQNTSLIDMPFGNGTFTWSNRRASRHQIASKLDCFLIPDNVVHLGGDFSAAILPHTGSNHWPIALQWQRPGNPTRRPFRFEELWLMHPSFKDMVKNIWTTFTPPEGSKMFQLQQKLRFLKGHLKQWNRETFGNIFTAQQELNKELSSLQQKIITEGHTEEMLEQERNIHNKLEERQKQEEIYWRQKSRIRWLREGERNTKFFHRTTVQRRMHNSIPFIQTQGGAKIEKHEEIEAEFLNHFAQVHTEPEGDKRLAIERITNNVPKIITEEHNELLLRPILMQEVDDAMSQLKEESRTLHCLLPSLNTTFIALIPKEEYSITPDKYRPIALCNVIYKVVSKVIANRLKPLLPMLISLEQSGYVEGWQIMDGILLTHEIIHSLKTTKQAGMLLKLDLYKAFDKLSWTYIQHMLASFGFYSMWVLWIMILITSTQFSILVNGIPSRPFKLTRGIQQGDPLSPFLFVLMAEGLGRHIKNVLLSHQLKGLSVHNTPANSHQQFVDDTMLFGYPSVQEASRFKALLNDFSEASSTNVNCSKSQIFFFHTPPSVKSAVARILGFPSASLPSKYLGAPLTASAIKHSTWQSLLEKLESRLNLWTHRTLNLVSQAVLIKSVLQAMPLYMFSILAAPKWVLKKIRNLQRCFLWGSTTTNHKWALVKWATVCMPKDKGGIRPRDPKHSNTIMGAKIWWQWDTNPDKPWAKLWTAKYANNRPQEELIRFTPNDKGSLMWNAAKQHYQLIQRHSFWEEEEHGFRQWKRGNQLIHNTDLEDAEQLELELRKRNIKYNEGNDILRWGYQPKGTYSPSEAYKIINNNTTPFDTIWRKIWELDSWPKVSHFLWLVGHKRILTWDKLRRRNFQGPSYCHNCKHSEETLQHLLDDCPLANQLWEKESFRCQRRCRQENNIINSLRQWPQRPYKSELLNRLWNIIPGLILWSIWKERNKRILKNQGSQIEDIWKRLCGNLQETLMLRSWSQEDLPSQTNEKSILDNWQLVLPQELQKHDRAKSSSINNCKWQVPPKNSYKLNFDGASKGNPGTIGFGGIIRNHEGSLLQIYFGNIGWDTNNSAELEGLWQGLTLAWNLNLQPLVMEGDSQILINMAKHLQNGSQANKIATSWRLEARLKDIEHLLRNNRVISFMHTKRGGNKVTDLLANIGVENASTLITGNTSIIPNFDQAQECARLIQNDIAAPDAGDGTCVEEEPHGRHVLPRVQTEH
eukprot:PITA_07130